MDVNTLAEQAWIGADAQGLHRNLDHVPTLGRREQALLALIPLTQVVNDIVQTVKRQGISIEVWDRELYDQNHRLLKAVERAFRALLRLCDDQSPALEVAAGDHLPATAIRLLLLGTEVCEAQAVLTDPDYRFWDDRCGALARELADVHIRAGDIEYGLGMDMNAVVTAVLQANRQRPYQYGTPGALAEEVTDGHRQDSYPR